MIRLIALAALLSFGCYLITGRWPWEFLAAKPARSQALFKARILLGVSEHASETEIRAAHRQKVAAIHPDRGGKTRATQDLNAARDLLLAERKIHPAEPIE